jgi:arsenate reductase-like glutaredoxin family protein
MSCEKAQEFLESVDGSVKADLDAKKAKMGPKEVLELLKKVDTVHAARGKNVVTFDLKKDRPPDTVLLEHLIGRSGNLRAPAAIVGRSLIVGFHPETYRHVLKV